MRRFAVVISICIGQALLAQEQFPVSFRLSAPNASKVTVAGEFNGWNETTLPMTRGPDGTWTASTRLPAGDYGYRFIVDGKWTLDPLQRERKTVDRLENSRLVVGPEITSSQTALNLLATSLAGTKSATGVPQVNTGSTWDADAYQQAATRYNSALDAFQKYLGSRSDPSQLRSIENNLHGCVDDFEKIKDGAPAKYNVQRMIDRCNKLIFDVHSTMQVSR